MKTILLLALSAIILSQSYGFAYGAEDIVTVVTDTSTYEEGDMINISGSISDYDESDPFKNFDVTLRLIAPNNNIINISQIPLDSDGSYSTFIPAQGPLWKSGGDYTISVSHGSDRNASTTFTFVLSESEEEVIEEVTEEYAVDKSRRYLSGISNGGAMAHRFACLHPEMLAAAASISGSIPRDRSCAPKIPISYLQVFGDKDTVTPINGKVSSDGWFYEKPEISFNKWAESMGCTEEIEASNLLTAESSNLICSSRRSCSKGRSLEVINCLVPDGGHAWPGQKPGVGFCRSKEQGSSIPNQKDCLDNNGKEINWGNEVIWEFFSKHRRENV